MRCGRARGGVRGEARWKGTRDFISQISDLHATRERGVSLANLLGVRARRDLFLLLQNAEPLLAHGEGPPGLKSLCMRSSSRARHGRPLQAQWISCCSVSFVLYLALLFLPRRERCTGPDLLYFITALNQCERAVVTSYEMERVERVRARAALENGRPPSLAPLSLLPFTPLPSSARRSIQLPFSPGSD